MNIFKFIWGLLKHCVTHKTVDINEDIIYFAYKGMKFDEAIERYLNNAYDTLPRSVKTQLRDIASILILAHHRDETLLDARQKRFMKMFFTAFVKRIERVNDVDLSGGGTWQNKNEIAVTKSYQPQISLEEFKKTQILPVDTTKTTPKQIYEMMEKERHYRPSDDELEAELMNHTKLVFQLEQLENKKGKK